MSENVCEGPEFLPNGAYRDSGVDLSGYNLHCARLTMALTGRPPVRWCSKLFRWRRTDVQRSKDAAVPGLLHLRPEVRQQVHRHPRASVPQEMARRERQTVETTATPRTEETATTTSLKG